MYHHFLTVKKPDKRLVKTLEKFANIKSSTINDIHKTTNIFKV